VIPLRAVGPILTAIGSLMLAWRGKRLIDSLLLAQSAADVNILSITGFLAKRLQHLPVVTGTDSPATPLNGCRPIRHDLDFECN
jgi:hypothetical protein